MPVRRAADRPRQHEPSLWVEGEASSYVLRLYTRDLTSLLRENAASIPVAELRLTAMVADASPRSGCDCLGWWIR